MRCGEGEGGTTAIRDTPFSERSRQGFQDIYLEKRR